MEASFACEVGRGSLKGRAEFSFRGQVVVGEEGHDQVGGVDLLGGEPGAAPGALGPAVPTALDPVEHDVGSGRATGPRLPGDLGAEHPAPRIWVGSGRAGPSRAGSARCPMHLDARQRRPDATVDERDRRVLRPVEGDDREGRWQPSWKSAATVAMARAGPDGAQPVEDREGRRAENPAAYTRRRSTHRLDVTRSINASTNAASVPWASSCQVRSVPSGATTTAPPAVARRWQSGQRGDRPAVTGEPVEEHDQRRRSDGRSAREVELVGADASSHRHGVATGRRGSETVRCSRSKAVAGGVTGAGVGGRRRRRATTGTCGCEHRQPDDHRGSPVGCVLVQCSTCRPPVGARPCRAGGVVAARPGGRGARRYTAGPWRSRAGRPRRSDFYDAALEEENSGEGTGRPTRPCTSPRSALPWTNC